MQLFWLGVSTAAYFILHSLLADNGVKRRLTSAVLPGRYYRVVYNVLAVLLLAPPLFLFFKMEKALLLPQHVLIAGAGAVLFLAGVYWTWKAMKSYDLAEFLGTYQLKNGRPPEHIALVTKGLNRYVRHPLYFGSLLIAWGFLLLFPTDATLVLVAVTTIYLYAGGKLEERKLTQQFGEAYRSYQRQVPMLLPLHFFKN